MRYISVFFIVFVIGCSVNDEYPAYSKKITFNANRNHYSLGSTVTATLENNSDTPVGINLCFTKLEQKSQFNWKFKGPNIFCAANLKELSPGKKENYQIGLADSLHLSEGQYRLLTSVEIKDNKVELKTQTFDVSGTTQEN